MRVIGDFTVQSSILADARTQAPAMVLELEELHLTEGEPVAILVWGQSGDFEAFEEGLHGDSAVDEYAVQADFNDRRLYEIRFTEAGKQAMVYPFDHTYETEMEILSASVAEETARVLAVFPDQNAFEKYRQFCQNQDVDFSLEREYREATETQPASV